MKKYSSVALFKYAKKSLRKNSQSSNHEQGQKIYDYVFICSGKKIYEYVFICSNIHIMTNIKFGTKNKIKSFSSGNKKRILPPHAYTHVCACVCMCVYEQQKRRWKIPRSYRHLPLIEKLWRFNSCNDSLSNFSRFS